MYISLLIESFLLSVLLTCRGSSTRSQRKLLESTRRFPDLSKMANTGDSSKNMFVSYWDTPGSPVGEEIVPAAQLVARDVVSSLKEAQELDPDQQVPVNNPEEVEDDEVMVVMPMMELQKVGQGGRRGRGGGRGRAGRGSRGGSSLPPATVESEEEAAQKRRKYTEEEERVLLDVMNLREFRARFANRTEKKDKVWTAVAHTFNEEMRRRNPQYNMRVVQNLRQKWDNQLRYARKHNLFVPKNNGTQGGSGNNRDVLESRVPPPYYEELLEAGWLQGPLNNPVNIMNGGTHVGDLDTEDLRGLHLGVQELDVPPELGRDVIRHEE